MFLLETFETILIMYLYGFTKIWPSIFNFVFYAASFVGLTFAIKKIEISVVYAVWSGVGTALIGILYFKQAATMLKFASISLIVTSVVGLKFSSSS